ncbi:MAG: hypothetical protein AAB421_03765 [Patescibacteria group bacterium]
MRFLLLLTLFFVTTSSYAHALALPNLGEPIILSVKPAIVEPESDVTVSIDSFLLDLNKSQINWFIDGKSVFKNRNLRSLQFHTGVIGSESVVSVIIQDPSGVEATADVAIRPVELDLLWEARSYTPPLYMGRALPAPGSQVVAEARVRFVRPNGIPVAEKDIVYTWLVNGKGVSSVSGRGRSSATFPAPLLFGEDILSVEAVSLDEKFRAERQVRIPSTEPLVVLYRADPLLGIQYQHPIPSRGVIGLSDVTVVATPFFTTTVDPTNTTLSYEWRVGGELVDLDKSHPSFLTLVVPPGGELTTKLDLVFRNTVSFLEEVSQSWDLSFQDTGSSDSNPFFRSVDSL